MVGTQTGDRSKLMDVFSTMYFAKEVTCSTSNDSVSASFVASLESRASIDRLILDRPAEDSSSRSLSFSKAP